MSAYRPAENRILIIGYGNTLRGDDAAGIRAAELIAAAHPKIHCECVHQLVPDLAEQIAEYETVFFLDADPHTEKLLVQPVIPGAGTNQPHTHFISPASLLRVTMMLYRRVPSEVFTIGIPAVQFELSETLSTLTADAVAECAAVINRYLSSGMI